MFEPYKLSGRFLTKIPLRALLCLCVNIFLEKIAGKKEHVKTPAQALFLFLWALA